MLTPEGPTEATSDMPSAAAVTESLEMKAGIKEPPITHNRVVDTAPHQSQDRPPRPPDPWAHRSEGMRCRSCMWFVAKQRTVTGTALNVGRCRRRAPTMNGYPAVFLHDWCGDHKLDENKITV